MEAVPFSIVSLYPSNSPKYPSLNKCPTSARFRMSPFAPTDSSKFPLRNFPLPLTHPARIHGFKLQSTPLESVIIEEKVEKSQTLDKRRKLYVLNLPWSLTVIDIKKLFGECGNVADVEIIKQKDGKSRGFAFVTMASGAEAQAAIEKFDSYELSGRIIRVEFANRFKKPSPPSPSGPTVTPRESLHTLYVSNLAWKVRSNNLREIISTYCNSITVRVVFDSVSKKSAGYGFASFATKEEAEAAISVLDGKELLGRPLRLKFSEKKSDASESKKEESNEEQAERSQVGASS